MIISIKSGTYKVLILIILLWSCHQSFALTSEKLCVLGMVREGSLEQVMLERYFSGKKAQERVMYLKSFHATPKDIRECFAAGATEIVLAVHTLRAPNSPREELSSSKKEKYSSVVARSKLNINNYTTNKGLAYFTSMPEEKHLKLLEAAREHLDNEIEALESKDTWFKEGQLQELYDIRTEWAEHTKNIPRDLFSKPISPLAFKYIRADLKAQRAKGVPIGTKSLRLLTCSPDVAYEAYPDLKALVKEFNISVTHSPMSPINSLIRWRRSSTSYDGDLFEEASQNNQKYIMAYVPIQTWAAVQFGKREVLSGQYMVSVMGMGFGLAHEWLLLPIPRESFEGLNKIGDSNQLVIPTLGMNVSPGIIPMTFGVGLQGTKGFNDIVRNSPSVGVTLGTVLFVDVERVR